MIFGICLLTGAAHGLIKPGELFPRMRFDLSLHKDSSKYFGLKKDKEIDISEINAEVLMVEVLSVYCVSCMSQTAYDRELYSMIEENKKTAGKVKMIGIGAGNNLREVNKFIDEFSVPYPVFPDYTFAQYNQVGQVSLDVAAALPLHFLEAPLGGMTLHEGADQAVPVAKVAVEGRHPQTRLGGDLLHGRARQTILAESHTSGLEDPGRDVVLVDTLDVQASLIDQALQHGILRAQVPVD